MSPFDDFFDRVFVINLRARTDRWIAVREELDSLRVRNYERIDAVRVDHRTLAPTYHARMSPKCSEARRDRYLSGACGCKLSHSKAVATTKT